MDDVFISYARATEAQACSIADALAALGYQVWRDDQLPVHRPYTDVIEEHLVAAKAVLVVWSAAAVRSDWVRSEADRGRMLGKLVQVRLDPTPLPLPFDQIDCADLTGWTGDTDAPAWRKVVSSLASLTGGEATGAPIGRPHAPHPALPGKPSIAVLPLRNANADNAREYFVDSLTEDIATELSRWRWFFVVSRHSSHRYKDRDIDFVQIGRELGVRYILEGSVGATGAKVRIRIRLVDAVDETTVWAEKYDRDIVEVLALEDEITQQIAAAIAPAMLDSVGARIARKNLDDASALDCCYRGLWELNQMSPDSIGMALTLFQEAVMRDPGLALGHLGLSRTLYARAIYGLSSDAAGDLAAALESARHAVSLDPYDAGGYFAAAGSELYLGDHQAALRDARRAVQLNQNFCYAHYRLGQVLIFCGQPEKALAPIADAIRLSPYDPQMGFMLETLALAHYQARDYVAAAEVARSAALTPNGGSAVLAASLARLGRLHEAGQVVARMPDAATSLRRPLVAPYADRSHHHHLRDGYRMAVSAVGQPAEGADNG